MEKENRQKLGVSETPKNKLKNFEIIQEGF
jgi:hypothetical protein